MPGFKLEQLDGDGEHIDLPDGDSVIGRGPFLHVSDKRVSRNHGLLQNADGQLRLKPTHVNPCFVQTSPDAAPEPLEKDKWHCLKDGEIFSLLPGKYIYRVHAVGEEGTPRNSQGFEEAKEEEEETTELNSKPPRSCEETLAYTPQAESSPSFTYESKTGDETHTAGPAACSQAGADSLPSCKSNAPDLRTPRKKRVLPAWMMDAAPAAANTPPAKAKRPPVRSTSSSKRSAGPKLAQSRVPSLSGDDEVRKQVEEEEEEDDENDEGCSKSQRKRARRQNRKQEEEEENEGCRQTPRKRARRLKSDTEESQEQDPVPKSNADTQKSTKTVHNVGQNVEEEKQEEKRVRAEGSQRSRTLSLESSQTSMQQKAKTCRRTPCPFGTSCYRKNPVHFQECSHPGDSDYEEEQNNKDDDDDDDDDDRPECPYGTDCYRKNPLHKKEYKHTKPPVNDDEDEDQYENSFINDDSEDEDVDEDSDYVPESEDSGKEDIKQLQKEAKDFIKKKKKL